MIFFVLMTTRDCKYDTLVIVHDLLTHANRDLLCAMHQHNNELVQISASRDRMTHMFLALSYLAKRTVLCLFQLVPCSQSAWRESNTYVDVCLYVRCGFIVTCRSCENAKPWRYPRTRAAMGRKLQASLPESAGRASQLHRRGAHIAFISLGFP